MFQLAMDRNLHVLIRENLGLNLNLLGFELSAVYPRALGSCISFNAIHYKLINDTWNENCTVLIDGITDFMGNQTIMVIDIL